MGIIAKNGIFYAGSNSSAVPTKTSELENDSEFIDVEEATDLITAIVDESIDNLEENISNLNLIDNPDFKINQRGQSEYSAGNNSIIHAMDRWRVGRGTVVTWYDDHINISCPEENYNFVSQKFEKDITNNTVTVSIKAKGIGVLNFGQLNVLGSRKEFELSDTYEIYHNTFSFIRYTGDERWRSSLSIGLNSGGNADVEWVKLELGNKATRFVPPNPTLEMMKCQRYYQVRSTSNINSVDLRPTMRISPTITQLSDGNYAYSADL